MIAGRDAADCLSRQPVKPGLDLYALGLLELVAERGSDGFCRHILGRHLVGLKLAQAFAISDLALDETLQPRQIDVDVTGDVNLRHGVRPDDSHGVLESCDLGRMAVGVAMAQPLMFAAENLL